MNTYTKTALTSERKLYVARKRTDEPNGYDIYRKDGAHPSWHYNADTNILKHIGGVLGFSPESLKDLAGLCSNIFDNN